MFQTDLTLDQQLFAFTPRDLVAEDSDVWLYIDLFDQLDLRGFADDYVSQGQAAKDPCLMLRTIFYGLTHGMVSGRKLADACRNDNRYVVLSGDRRPDCRTLHRFLVRHEERLAALFVQIVRLASAMGLVKLGRVAIDGSRFKANTSKHKAMSYDRMQKAIAEITAELATLKAELAKENTQEATGKDDEGRLPAEIARREARLARIAAAKKALESETEDGEVAKRAQKSFADHDALPLGGKGGFIYGYNAQAVVDEASQIIVAAELHDSAADSRALPPLLDKVEETCGKTAGEVLADAGYMSAANVADVEERGATPLIAPGKGEQIDGTSLAEQLTPTSVPGEYLCPAGKLVPVKNRKGDGTTELKLPGRFCNNCPQREGCRLYPKRGKSFRVPAEADRERLARHRARMREEGSRAAYSRRKVICEPVFGNIKNKGMKILVRGKTRVAAWWKLAATAHNVEKIIGHMGGMPPVGA